MPRNLYLSYAVTWVIHAVYIVYLWRRNQRVKQEETALKNS